MSNLYALDDVLYHLNTVTTIGIEQGCRDCVQVATALSTPVALPASIEELVSLWESVEKIEVDIRKDFSNGVWATATATADSGINVGEPYKTNAPRVTAGTFAAALIALAKEID